MKVCCVSSSKSSHEGDSNEYTQYNHPKKITLNYHNFAAMGFYPRDSRMSSKRHDKRAISVRATEDI